MFTYQMNKRKLVTFLAIFISTFFLINSHAKAANFTDNQTVDANKVWTIKFSQEVNLDEVAKQGIIVTDSKGNVVNTDIELGQDNKTLRVLAPQDGYKIGESYTLNIDTKVHSKSGKNIKEATALHFYAAYNLGNQEITQNGVTYTWQGVKSRMLNAGLGSDLFAKSFGDLYMDVFKEVDPVYLTYNSTQYKQNDDYDAFTMNSIKRDDLPYMDFGLLMGAYDGDYCAKIVPNFQSKLENAENVICESIFPGRGAEFYPVTDNVTLRTAIKGNIAIDLPTVYFFGGRRIFVTPHRMGFTTMEFSGINDNSNIWSEIYTLEQFTSSEFSVDELKKYMPELKNY